MSAEISYSKTFRNLTEFQLQYNEKQRNPENGRLMLTRCLRKQHIQTYEHILRSFCKKINKEYKDLQAIEDLPPLMINNKILSDYLKCSKRCIYDHISRLEQAGLLKKKFRGSEFCYELHLNPSILAIKFANEQGDIIAEYNQMINEETREEVTAHVLNSLDPRQTLPHSIDTGYSNNELSISAVDKSERASDSPDQIDLAGHLLAGHTTSKLQKGSGRPRDDQQALSAKVREILMYVETLWSLMFTKIYADQYSYIARSQVNHAKRYLADQFLDKPDRIIEVYGELFTRISMVDRWYHRVGKDGQKPRFVPLPQNYFDPDNPKGFEGTKAWYQSVQDNSEKLKEYSDQAAAELQIYQKFREAVEPVASGSGLDWIQYKSSLKQLKELKHEGLINSFFQMVSDGSR